MLIKAVCMAYNEEFLMPFFLRHYRYLDEIRLVVDADTNDLTREIARQFGNVVMEEFQFPAGMDDILKRDKLTATARSMQTDWLYVLDADEFIFPPGLEDPRSFLARQTANVVVARMWQVFRHITDKPLDPMSEPIVLQRRHGDPNRDSPDNAQYQKPIVLKLPLDFRMCLGNHDITGTGLVFAEEHFDGAHWAHADPKFVIERRIKNRRDRQSQRNLQLGLTSQHHHVTEEEIRSILNTNANRPLVF